MNAVDLAVRMETDAIKFYKEAANRTSHTVGKRMFLSIVEDEKRHLEMLSRLIKGLELEIHCLSPLSNIKSIFAEMKDQMLEKVRATTDELEVLKIAMQMEKESFEFYKKNALTAASDKEKALFEGLVKEEQEHFTIFENTYSFLTDTENWFMWDEHSMVDGGTPWA